MNKKNWKKLESSGAKKVADFNYKRRIYNFNLAINGKWIRLRTDGKNTTLTIKEIKSNTIDGTEEIEIQVSDFEQTNSIIF